MNLNVLHELFKLLITLFPLNSTVTDLQFVNTNGDVIISRSTDPLMENITITVRQTTNMDEMGKLQTVIMMNNTILFFEQSLPSNVNFWEALLLCSSSDINVTIPMSFKGDVLMAKTTNGNVNANEVTISTVTLSSTNGNLDLKSIVSNSLVATTTNGNINFANVESKSLSVSTTNGDITSQGFIKMVDSSTFIGSTTNGNINFGQILVSNVTTTINLSSTSGNIGSVINEFGGSFDSQTTAGNVNVQGKGIVYSQDTGSHKSGNIGTGTSSCNLKTTFGNINLSFTV